MNVRLVHKEHGEFDCYHKDQLAQALKNGWKIKEETKEPIKRRGRPPKAE